MAAAGQTTPPAQLLAQAAPPSLGQTGMQQYLDLLNSPGTMTGGSAGSPGYMQSGAGGRQAATDAFNNASAGSKEVYSNAVNAVLARADGIGSSYDNAASSIQNQAAARDAAATAAATQRASRASAGAAGLGFGFTPTTADRAGNNQLAQTTKAQTNAASWSGLLGAQKQTALSGNNRMADAFRYSGTQAQDALSKLLQSAIERHPDVYHAGTAGRPGKLVGAATLAQKLAGAKFMVDTQGKNDAAGLAAQKYKSSVTPTQTTTTKSTDKKTGATTSVTTKGKTK